MRLLSVKSARSIWLFPISDINPTGKYEVSLVQAIGSRYRFVLLPNLVEASKGQSGVKFENGLFQHETLGDLHINFTIHKDGVVADTNASTDASDAFLSDVLNWTIETIGMTAPQRIRKLYVSEVYVSTEKNISQISDKLASIAAKVSEALDTEQRRVECAGLWFAADFGDGKPARNFRFERAEGVAFEDNRYYSLASTHTSKHLALLDHLEKVMAS